jgi:glycosyltransferase involved in cell wall biosynthesis
MNILHLYKDYFPVQGGIENHIQWLAEAQAARGHQVSVLVTSRDRHTHIKTMNGVRVIFAARLATISSAPISLAMLAFLRREQPDIVHLQFPYPWGEAANYFFGRAHKTVLTYQSDIVRQKYLRVVYAPLMQCVLARADAIIATSPNYVASSPVLSRWKDKCVVIPLAIDPSPFETAAPDASLTPRRAPLLLFVGRLRYYKGLQYLLRALTELPTAHLHVIGSGPMENAWRSLANGLQVADRVTFAGDVADADLPSAYAACDVFVLPSSERSEAFGLVQLEAMAAGKPVVSTELGTGTSFVNVDGETGFVVPARDPHALASAIKRLIDDRTLRERMGTAARARVEQQFKLEKMVDRILALYENLISGNK